MIYDFDFVIDRKNTFAIKEDIRPEGSRDDAIPAWIADMDFPVCQPILDALHKRVDHGIFGYTYYNHAALKEATAEWLWRRFGWRVPHEAMIYSPGVVPALAGLIQILSEEGQGVIIQQPVYHPFAMKIESSNRVVVNNALTYNGGRYTIDFDDLESKMKDPNNAGLILCSPHNPVGRVWTQEELLKIVDIAKRYDKWIIADEIHMDITRTDVTHHPLAKIAEDYRHRIFTCTAPSKTFNIAGLHLSNLIIFDEDIRTAFNGLALGSPNPFAMDATIAAYTDGDEWLDQLLEYLDDTFAWMEEFVRNELPKATLVRAEATYLAWLDLNAYVDPADVLEEKMKAAGLIFNEGKLFGPGGDGFERINFATPRAVVQEMFYRLRDALA